MVQSTYWSDASAAGAKKVNTGRRCCVLDCWGTWRIPGLVASPCRHVCTFVVLSHTENPKHTRLQDKAG